MKVTFSVIAVLLTIVSLLPLSKQEFWWIRIWDYPRVQLAIANILVIILMLIFRFNQVWHWALIIVLGGVTVYQAALIIKYTPLVKVQSLRGSTENPHSHIKLFINNVRQYNTEYNKVLDAVNANAPDIVLLMETDAVWAEKMNPLLKTYSYNIAEPLPNTYGILFFSKLPLQHAEIKHWVEDTIPSVYAKVQLPGGDIINLFGLHPKPPTPGDDTDERDAELVMVGKNVKKSAEPCIVVGDLNDVAWSHTTRLFQRVSGTLDPRVGRGFFNTYNAKIPVFRFPLDHVFHTPHFRLVSLKVLPGIGSDHFPVLVELSYEPEKKPEQKPNVSQPHGDDHDEANRKIQQVQ